MRRSQQGCRGCHLQRHALLMGPVTLPNPLNLQQLWQHCVHMPLVNIISRPSSQQCSVLHPVYEVIQKFVSISLLAGVDATAKPLPKPKVPLTVANGQCNVGMPSNVFDRFLWVINYYARSGFKIVVDNHGEILLTGHREGGVCLDVCGQRDAVMREGDVHNMVGHRRDEGSC
eukprot:GHUV01031055.1.p1 GENE.GHUV01031055.1~~GHUV01031055.1.p1  ORF type:complete len:173 (+),score=25.73 GHUV01031055.1:689-1207(+)